MSIKAFSPGRVEFIGNHLDYNLGLVMGAATHVGMTVTVSTREDNKIVFSDDGLEGELNAATTESIEKLDGDSAWANYPLGVVKALLEDGMAMPHGFSMHIHNDIPQGAGMSSSAAFELSTAHALCALYNYPKSKEELAILCKKVENEFVGMPCGILDQGVCAMGEENALVTIDCTNNSFGTIAVPENWRLWVFNTNVAHKLTENPYALRVQECKGALDYFKPLHGIERLTQLTIEQAKAAEDKLPENIYKRALHVATEQFNVYQMRDALANKDYDNAGQWVTASHWSSSKYYENSTAELDVLVELLTPTKGVLGARLTGGGWGGAVMALTDTSFTLEQAEREIAKPYTDKFGVEPTIIPIQIGAGARVL